MWLKFSGYGCWFYFVFCLILFLSQVAVVGLAVVEIFRLWFWGLILCVFCQAVVFGLVLSLFCQAVLFFGLAFLSGCGLCFGLVSV